MIFRRRTERRESHGGCILAKRLSKKLSRKQDQKLIRKLQAENRRLRRENEYLRHLSVQFDPKEEEDTSPEQKMLLDSVKQAETLRSKTYFAYLLQKFRRSRPFLIFDKTRFAMKGIRFAKKMWVFFIGFFTFLGISAQFLLILGSLAVFIPAALIASAVIGIYSYFSHRKRNRAMQLFFDETVKEKIYLVFLSKDRSSGYFTRNLSSLTEKGHVFLIMHSFRDCDRKGFSRIDDHIYKMHISSYFSFARRLPPERVVKIYL